MIALTWDRTWDLYIWALFTSPLGMNSAIKIRRLIVLKVLQEPGPFHPRDDATVESPELAGKEAFVCTDHKVGEQYLILCIFCSKILFLSNTGLTR